ncbi:MAG TPA: tail fiber domain-containing protein [Nitrospiraceae bacterium]
MAFDFPSSPTNGQEYTSGSITFVWNGYGWTVKGSAAPADIYVLKTGDTMSGALEINSPSGLRVNSIDNAIVMANKTGSGYNSMFTGASAGKTRWVAALGDYGGESSGNVGSNFALFAYNDAGDTIINTPLRIYRSNFRSHFTGAMGVGFDLTTLTSIYSTPIVCEYSVYTKQHFAINCYVDASPAWRTIAAGNSARMYLSASTLVLEVTDAAGTANALLGAMNAAFWLNASASKITTNLLELKSIGSVTVEHMLRFPAAPAGAVISSATASYYRWKIFLGDGAAESGSNVGSNFIIQRFGDTGTYLGAPLTINRADGSVSLTGQVLLSRNFYIRSGATDGYSGAWYSTSGIQDRFFVGTESGTADIWRIYTASSGNSFQVGGNGTVRANFNFEVGQSFNVTGSSGFAGLVAANAGLNVNNAALNAGYGLYVTHNTASWLGSFINYSANASGFYVCIGHASNIAFGVLRNDQQVWQHQLFSNGNYACTGTIDCSGVATFRSNIWVYGGVIYVSSGGHYFQWYPSVYNFPHGDLRTTSGGVDSYFGFACRGGNNTTPRGNTFNVDWNGSPHMYIDYTYIGQIAFVSDHRAKKDITPLSRMWEVVKAMKPIRYTRKDFTPPSAAEHQKKKNEGAPFMPGDDVERWGFLAHELQETLLPSAATGTKDDPKALQSPDPWPVLAALTKTLQEAMSRIETLEGLPHA